MKKTMKWLGALALMMMCAFSFTACGGDDDDDPSPSGSTEKTTAFKGAKRIFGSNLVKAYGREGYDRYTVTYDANGFVTKVHRDRYNNGTVDKTEEVTITYSGSQALASTYKNGTFAGNVTFTVGSNGFASSVTSFTNYNTVMYYDSDGHMTKLTASESGRSEDMTWNWQDGDIVTAYWDGDTPTSISYTDANHSTPVTNVSGVIEWDHIMGIDMDDDITYFTGAMGYGPKHLPLAWTDGSSSATVTWTLDSQGRAVKAVVQETGEYNNSTKTFFWEY